MNLGCRVWSDSIVDATQLLTSHNATAVQSSFSFCFVCLKKNTNNSIWTILKKQDFAMSSKSLTPSDLEALQSTLSDIARLVARNHSPTARFNDTSNVKNRNFDFDYSCFSCLTWQKKTTSKKTSAGNAGGKNTLKYFCSITLKQQQRHHHLRRLLDSTGVGSASNVGGGSNGGGGGGGGDDVALLMGALHVDVERRAQKCRYLDISSLFFCVIIFYKFKIDMDISTLATTSKTTFNAAQQCVLDDASQVSITRIWIRLWITRCVFF